MLVTLLGIVTLVRPLQPENAWFSMLVTLLGIVTLVMPLQPENACFSMLVTLLGIVTLVRPLQLEYLQPVITQYFASNKSEIWS